MFPKVMFRNVTRHYPVTFVNIRMIDCQVFIVVRVPAAVKVVTDIHVYYYRYDVFSFTESIKYGGEEACVDRGI